MRKATVLFILALLLTIPSMASLQELSADDRQTLYALGRSLSQGLAPFMLSPIEDEAVQAGLRDGVLGTGQTIDLHAAQGKIQALQRTRATAVAAAEKKSGQDYREKMATVPGAARTASGLIITNLAPGGGAAPQLGDRVKAHYEGTLIDGTVFDSSRQRGEPATFSVSGVIACWTEALQLMKVGGKSRLVCPASIAYGDRGAPPRIKPGATLVFEVELLEIVK